jgi:mannose-6-phosphate isomerase-like protein (cupin superfamily)
MMNVFTPSAYTNLDSLEEQLAKEGLSFQRITEQPCGVYDSHLNLYDQLLVFVSGSAVVRVGNQTFHCQAGDRLLIPGCVEHSAEVGPDGCAYMLSRLPMLAD